MPIPLEGLKAAQVNTSDNPFLKPLWKAVETYETSKGLSRVASHTLKFDQFRATGVMPTDADHDRRQRAMALQDIMFNAAGFLTCKPPDASKQKRHPRWDAVTNLMAEVNREAAAIGVKLVDSPTDFRTIGDRNASVWLEVVDPRHRDFGLLSEKYEDWAKDPKAREASQSFWKYVGDDDTDATILYDLGAKSQAEKNSRGLYAEFQGNTIDTKNCRTYQAQGGANSGWAIFAVTTDGRLHVGEHSNEYGASVRHTSLTGGEPILAAGEICIVNGKISAISNLTGHYKLGVPQFFNWLNTSPLVSPEVVVKARLNVKVEKEDKSDPNNVKTEIVSDYMITGARVENVRKWVADGKPMDEYPLVWDRQALKDAAPGADFFDVREPIYPIVEAELQGGG